MEHTRLKTHLLTYIFLYVIIFLLIVTGIVSFFVSKSLTNMAFEKTDNTLRILELQLNQSLEHPLKELDELAALFYKDRYNFEQNSESLIGAESYIQRLDVVSNDGIIESTFPLNPSAVGFDLSNSNVYKTINFSENNYEYGEMTLDPFSSSSTMFIAMKVDDKYMIGYLNLDEFHKILERITINDGYITVSDENGTYIGHSNGELVAQRSVDTNVTKLSEGNLSNRSTVLYLGQKCILQYRKLQNYNWYIMYYQFYDTIYEPIRHVIITILLVSIVSLPIILLLILRIIRRVDESLEHLVLTTKRIAEGHYDVVDSDFHYDEFYHLFQSVSDMSRQVEEREEEISSLNDELEMNYYTMAVLLAKAIEAKDNYTGNHCERVRDLSMILGEGYHLNQEELRELKFGATLHDIGKIGIPETILNKEGRLTEEEFDIIKSHSQVGFDIMSEMPSMRLSKQIILHHHEHFDGSGYPYGLVGKEIPLLAKIVSIADAFDAMTSERPYRKQAMTTKQAFDELRKNEGIQFDPELVTLFIKLVKANSIGDY